MQLPINIGLHRSRLLDVLILTCALLASALDAFFPVPSSMRVGLVGLIWGVAAWAWLRLAPPFAGLRLERDGGISIRRYGATDLEGATLLSGATVHPWLSIVRLKTDDGRRHWVILAGDTPEGAAFRRLRVFLRWRADFVRPSGDDA